MQQVPTVVHGLTDRPIHHGIVERSYDKLRAIVQMYVLHKQEDRSCVCLLATCTQSITCYSIVRPCASYRSTPLHTSHQEIKFGDASDVVRANKHRITYDEFEYDTTSVRRIESTACVALISAFHAVASSVHSPVMYLYTYANHHTAPVTQL